MYAIVDINNFYASCERVFNPKIRNIPVVVLSNNDGCIIARSNEAKKLGINMGETYFKIKDFLAQNNVAIYSSNYPLYADMSERMVNVILEIVENVQIYSIDEVFIDLTKYKNTNFQLLAETIKNKIYKYTGLPVSIGIAPTKTLAKAANVFAKKYPKFKNIMILSDEEKIKQALKIISVDKIWGIGRKYSKFLKANNIKTALDLAQANPKFVKKYLTVTGLRTQQELNSLPCIITEGIDVDRKNILNSRSFKKPVETYAELKAAVATFTSRSAEKLREQKSAASIIGVFIYTGHYNYQAHGYSNSKTLSLPVPSDNTFELIKYAIQALSQIYIQGYKYKKAGVYLSGLQDNTTIQFSIFDEFDRMRYGKAMKATDNLNKLLGRDTVRFAVQGKNTKISVQEMLSKRYTTSWSEILTVNLNQKSN